MTFSDSDEEYESEFDGMQHDQAGVGFSQWQSMNPQVEERSFPVHSAMMRDDPRSPEEEFLHSASFQPDPPTRAITHSAMSGKPGTHLQEPEQEPIHSSRPEASTGHEDQPQSWKPKIQSREPG